jgi:pimeloyl-ACP methyl ester carboxylesterase
MTDTSSASSTPTVVLVHGAFADASGWAGVIERLMAAGVPVRAVVNPLRGVSADSAYAASVIRQIAGPVLAVGHSYGGAVITNAGSMAGNVVGLVYVAAFAPDEGETLAEIEAGSADSILPAALRQTDYPVGPASEVAGELSVDVDLFREAFAADLPEQQAAVMARSQRPVSVAAFGEPTGAPAWKKLPSWAVVGTRDKAAGADVVLSMARRAGAEITEVDASHVPMMSQPDVVTDVILKAAKAVS